MDSLGFMAPPLSYNALEEIAKQLRSIFKIKGSFPANKLEWILYLLYKDTCTLYITKDIQEEGLTYLNGELIVLKEDVYDGLLKDDRRCRFTAIHELSHRILHCNNSFKLVQCRADGIPAYSNPEWQANALAGAILCPADQIKNDNMCAEDIMEKFLVSRSCAEKRLSIMGKITIT